MILPPLTEIRAWTDPGEAHLAHVALHGFAIDQHLIVQLDGDLARAIERTRGIDFVDAPLDPEFFRGRRHRLIIQAAAIQTEQVGLDAHGQFAIGPVYQGDTLISREVRGQIFFEPSQLSR